MSGYAFRVGKLDCLLIEDFSSTRVTSKFMPSVPQDELEQVVRQQGIDPDALPYAITPTVIRAGGKTLLVDTGEGGTRGNLPQHLAENGIAAEEIDTVIITHGHWDHVGGILDAMGNFVYPNANYVFWSTEWNHWTDADRIAASNPNQQATWNTLLAHQQRISLVGGDNQPEAEIMPGVCAIATPGHTVGHISVEFTSEGEKLLVIGDAAHHWFQLQRPQWSPGFDFDKEQAAVTRRALFERAARDNALFAAYHFPFPGIGRITSDGDKFT